MPKSEVRSPPITIHQTETQARLPYEWPAAQHCDPLALLTAQNAAGLTTTAAFTVTPDTTAPTGQTVALVGGPYFRNGSVPLTVQFSSAGTYDPDRNDTISLA